MRLTHFLHRWLHVAAIAVTTFTQTVRAQDDPVPADPVATAVTTETGISGDIEISEDGSALLRGPVHEAFAEQFSVNVSPSEVIGKEPPQPIDEVPPDFRPTGENIQWIPGYWGWDIAFEDFVWVTGVWRAVPPDQQWIPGYWSEAGNGFQWINGFWTGVQTEQLVYMPIPPESIEAGPSVPAPGDDYFWIPGSWQYNQNQNNQSPYDWQAGYWSQGHDDWVWIPSRYIWTPSGCIYREGYWDYVVQSRGTMFSPMAFRSGYNQQFRPRYVVETGPLWLANLFVLPGLNQYAFGNYYGYRGNRQIYPWVNYYQRSRGYDPLFSYYAYQNRNTNLIRQIARVERQIAGNPQYRAQTTVAAQLLAINNLQGPQANWALRAVQLNSLATQSNLDFDTPFQFASVDAERRTQLSNAISPAREFAQQRRELERADTREDRQRAVRADARASVQADAQADAQAENRNDARADNPREDRRENANRNPDAEAAAGRNVKRLAIRADDSENGRRRLSQTDAKPANTGGANSSTATNADRPNADRPNADRPNADRPNADRPNADKPNADKPNADRPNADRPNADRPNADRPNADRPDADKANADRPNADKPNADRPNADRPNADRPNADRPNANNPNTDRPSADRPNADKPNANLPDTTKPDANRPGNLTDNPASVPGAGRDKPDSRADAKPGNAPNSDRPRTQNPGNQNPGNPIPANQNPSTPNLDGRSNNRGDRPTPNTREQNPNPNAPGSRDGIPPTANPAARDPRSPLPNNPLDRIQQGLDDKGGPDDARALRDMMRRTPRTGGTDNPGTGLPGQRNPASNGNRPNIGLPPATNPGQPNPGQPNPGQPNPGQPAPGQTIPGQNRNPLGNAPTMRPPSLPRQNQGLPRQNPGAGAAPRDNAPGPAARPPVGNSPLGNPPGLGAGPGSGAGAVPGPGLGAGPGRPAGNPPGPATARPAGNPPGPGPGRPAANPPGPGAGRPAGNPGGSPAGNAGGNPGRGAGGSNRSEGRKDKDK